MITARSGTVSRQRESSARALSRLETSRISRMYCWIRAGSDDVVLLSSSMLELSSIRSVRADRDVWLMGVGLN